MNLLRLLVAKEVRELLLGRVLWPLLVVLSILVGFSFRQALTLYGEASRTAITAPELGAGLHPFEGILVPTFGALYLVTTLLWPFVVIRQLGGDRRSGALKLFVQLPSGLAALVLTKVLALVIGWLLVLTVPMFTALMWHRMGGFLHGPELLALLAGHTLYAAVIAGLSLAAAAWSDSLAAASLVALAASLGSWALDFGGAGQGRLSEFLQRLSLTRVLRPWEQGLVGAWELVDALVLSCGFLAVMVLGLLSGRALRRRLAGAAVALLACAAVSAGTSGVRPSLDVTEARRNSFAPEDEEALGRLSGRLSIEAFFSPEDPRLEELERAVLLKLRRSVAHLDVRLTPVGSGRFGPGEDERYGEVVYRYEGRSDSSRSTSPREVLPLLWRLTGSRPGPATWSSRGHPLVPSDPWSGLFFYLALPALIVIAGWAPWWRSYLRKGTP